MYNVSLISMNFKLAAKRILPLVYFLAVSLPHHPFSDWFDKNILNPVGVTSVQNASDIVFVVLALVVLSLWIFAVRNHRSLVRRHCIIWCVSFVLIFLADRYLIVNNIERIHFPQYTILALLLGLSLRDELLIFSVASLAGFVDEFLQYFMNPYRTNYLDFNDIVLNIIGAGLGIALLIALRKPAIEAGGKYEKRFTFVLVISVSVLAALFLIALAFDRIVMVAEHMKQRSVFYNFDGKLSFIISFERHDQFWQRSAAHGKAYHVLSPFEGLSIIFLLSTFTWWWTRVNQDKREKIKDKRRNGGKK